MEDDACAGGGTLDMECMTVLNIGYYSTGESAACSNDPYRSDLSCSRQYMMAMMKRTIMMTMIMLLLLITSIVMM